MRRKITYELGRDYYVILGVSSQATPDEIRQAYRRTVREVHPDLHPDQADWATEQLQRINEAYATLSEPDRRKEYDRVRWPHIPHEPRPASTAYQSPFRAPDYDPDRPWWEQTAPFSPRSTSRRAGPPPTPERPSWLAVSDWLKGHGLGVLEPSWLTMIGLWRSPYAGLLAVLSVVLALNVAVIIYAFIAPESTGLLGSLFPAEVSLPTPATSAPFPSATPDQLNPTCADPRARILSPLNYDVVADQFAIYGTVQELWNYRVDVGYIGSTVSQDSLPERWETVRTPPQNQSMPEPSIQEGLLAESVDLSGRTAGYYVVRLRVELRDGRELAPCDVIVRR